MLSAVIILFTYVIDAVLVCLRFKICDIFQNITIVVIDDYVIDSGLSTILLGMKKFLVATRDLRRRIIRGAFNHIKQVLAKENVAITH